MYAKSGLICSCQGTYRIFTDPSPAPRRASVVVDTHLSVVSVCLDEDAFEAGLNVVDVVIVLQATVKKIERKQMSYPGSLAVLSWGVWMDQVGDLDLKTAPQVLVLK